MKPELIILIGNIGSGKTTLCRQKVSEGCVIVSRDDLRYLLGAGKYLYSTDLEKAVKITALSFTEELMKLGKDIVIDETNMNKIIRLPYIELGKKYDYNVTARILPYLTKLESVNRRLQNNHGDTTMETWNEVWEHFSNMYEEPSLEEGFDKILYLE